MVLPSTGFGPVMVPGALMAFRACGAVVRVAMHELSQGYGGWGTLVGGVRGGTYQGWYGYGYLGVYGYLGDLRSPPDTAVRTLLGTSWDPSGFPPVTLLGTSWDPPGSLPCTPLGPS